MSHYLEFFKQFRTTFETTGAIAPSSRFLATNMTGPMQHHQGSKKVLEIGPGLDFDYHNYGPFSAELAFASEDAEDFDLLEMAEYVGRYSIPYTIFRTTETLPEIDDLETDRIKDALAKMQKASSVVLELAATAVYFQKAGYGKESWQEVQTRKPLKATEVRIESAQQLLAELGL